MTQAQQLADLSQAYTAAALGFRNKLINGDGRIAQRPGAQFPSGSNGFGAADRWKCNNSSGSGIIYTSQTTMFDQNGISKSCVFQRCDGVVTAPTGTTAISGFNQIIEGYDCAHLVGSPVALSFVFRANVAGTYSVALRDSTNANSCAKAFNYPTPSVAQYLTFLFPPIPAAAVIPVNTGIGLQLNIGAVAGPTVTAPVNDAWVSGNFIAAAGHTNWASTVNNQIAITDAQLEIGTIVTPFERRPTAIELSLCQRYTLAITGMSLGIIYNGSYTQGGCMLFPSTMRVAPVLMPGATYTASPTAGTPALLNQTPYGCGFYNPSNNWSTGGGVVINNAILSAEY
jgi:hypothetical protein